MARATAVMRWGVLVMLMCTVALRGQDSHVDPADRKGDLQAAAPEELTIEVDEPAGPWWTWERVTGDWGGLRTEAEEQLGLTLEATYYGDYWNNTAGGLNTSDAHIYQGLFDLSLTLDTAQTGWWEGGTFFVDFQTLHGRSITEEYVGDLQFMSNIDSPALTQVAEYGYEQRIWEDCLRIKLGKIDVNADFAYVDYGLEFIHSSPGFHPNIPMPTYPDQALGVALFVDPVEWLYAGAGVFDGFGEGTGSRWGFDTALHGADGAFTIFELGVRPQWELGGRSYPGRYYTGGWYHSGKFEMFPTRRPYKEGELLPAKTHRGNAGLYLGVDQWLYHEAREGEPDDQGLAMFFQFSVAPSGYNEIVRYYGGGLRYQGLIPTRDEDVTGVGVFHAGLSDHLRRLEDRHAETAVEVFHRIQVTPAVALTPDVQYIVNPGGAGRDALVVGMRFEVAF